jgi:hypothetical protein
MRDMSFQAGQGRSYKYLHADVTPLYEFGAGLSYTTFRLSVANATAGAGADGGAVEHAPVGAPPVAGGNGGAVSIGPNATTVCVTITNTGAATSAAVITLFAVPIKLVAPPPLVPNRKLLDFVKKVVPGAGVPTDVCFSVVDTDLALVDEAGTTSAYAGEYTLVFFDGLSKVTVPVGDGLSDLVS